jgi:uncharacterized membrane protein
LSHSTEKSRASSTAGKFLDVAVIVLYPLIVLVGIPYLGIRWTALLLLLLVARRVVTMVLLDKQASKLVLVQALAMAGIIGAAGLSGSPLALRLAPFAVSLTFIALFAGSLRQGHLPIIERFARLTKPDLPREHVRYCRGLTVIWVVVLGGNSCLVLGAAFMPTDALWAILVGPVSYGLLGMVFTVEYLYRKWRFQDFEPGNPIDRLLRPLLRRGDK